MSCERNDRRPRGAVFGGRSTRRSTAHSAEQPVQFIDVLVARREEIGPYHAARVRRNVRVLQCRLVLADFVLLAEAQRRQRRRRADHLRAAGRRGRERGPRAGTGGRNAADADDLVAQFASGASFAGVTVMVNFVSSLAFTVSLLSFTSNLSAFSTESFTSFLNSEPRSMLASWVTLSPCLMSLMIDGRDSLMLALLCGVPPS